MVNREPDRGETTATPMNVGYWIDFGCADADYDQEVLNRRLDALGGVEGGRPDRAGVRTRPREGA